MRVLLKKEVLGGIMFNSRFFLIIGILCLLSLLPASNAHEEEDESQERVIDAESLKSSSIRYVAIASFISMALVIVSLSIKDKNEKIKWILFLGILIPIAASTAYLAYSTVYLNIASETKGPVHWHADYEVWICDKQIEIIKPKGLSNRIGNALFHDHGDNRIHVEGVVTDTGDVDLHNFFETIGGHLDYDRLGIPGENGFIGINNGQLCNGEKGKLQAFVYRTVNPDENNGWIFRQQKLDKFENHILSPYSNVPPGD